MGLLVGKRLQAILGALSRSSALEEASAAACAATQKLADARHALTRTLERPPQKDVRRRPPRIGVFVCNCGINIGGVVDVPAVLDRLRASLSQGAAD